MLFKQGNFSENNYCLSLNELKKNLTKEMTEDMLYGKFTVGELLVLEIKKPLKHSSRGYINFLNRITAYKMKNVDVSQQYHFILCIEHYSYSAYAYFSRNLNHFIISFQLTV